jgi:poly-gamma-glutamate synthesis protein (capsule biosynthesis protein)
MKKVYIFTTIMLAAFFAGLSNPTIENVFGFGSFVNFLPFEQVDEDLSIPTSLSFVGDVLLARRVETYLDTYGSSYVYSSMPTVSSSTVLIGNFESSIPVLHTQTPDLTFSFSVDAVHVPALYEYGFRYVSLANNHSADKGLPALNHTKKVLEESGLRSVGSPLGLSTTSIEYIELQGKKVALIGVYAVAVMPSEKEIIEVLAEATVQSDYQIAYVHWGTEYELTHSDVQEKLAYIMIDAGADAVIGHHPHVVQDIELYKGVPIFYSLGNFIFDQYFSTDVQKGLWVEVQFSEDSVVYALQGITSVGSRSVPRYMAAYENDLFLSTLAKKSTKSLSAQILQGKITQ